MSLTRLILRFAAPVPRIEQFERYLFIGPHPDDIEIGAGATAAKLAAMGKQITFLICTDGRYGTDNTGVSGEALISLRQKEAVCSAGMLGVSDVRFLNLSDGGFYTQDELMNGIAVVIGDVQPDVIIAPDPCVPSECHIDHLNVGNAARMLSTAASNRGIMEKRGAAPAQVHALAYYMTARPNRFVGTRGFIQKQMQAIFDCHLSQFPKGNAAGKGIALYLRIRALDFGLRSLRGCAEGFRALGEIHMHCLPESK
ncbi:MAG: PIG-L family deacetylase [Clostridia bacterium]|nr:PIG-L family deacetylase [Clostridia bacterium]